MANFTASHPHRVISLKLLNVDYASFPTLCFQGLATFFSPVCCVYVATKLKATLRTFCADAVLAQREDRHVSWPSDCFFGYHSPSAITRSLGLWFLSATSRSFLRLWLHPGRLAPDRSPSFFTPFMDIHFGGSVVFPLLSRPGLCC